MTEPLAEFKVKVWEDVIHGKDAGPIYEVLVKKRFAFATYYKRVSYAFDIEQVGIVIQNYRELMAMTDHWPKAHES